jgi:orotidine-5'-phosphate decarboxylase
MTYRERLARATRNGFVCVGLDPAPEKLPAHLRDNNDGLVQFLFEIVRATAKHAAAYKPNLAFFESLGPEGDEALRLVIDEIRQRAPMTVIIGDGKRGDIGSTAERYASAMFDRWGFDATTVNPYFGSDGVLPFVSRPDHGAYLLAATSNPSAVEVQRAWDGVALPNVIAKLARDQWNEYDNVGLVVGATRLDEMATLRDDSGDLPWLIPGIGAQGGDLASSLKYGVTTKGVPSLVNASRSILYASSGEDFAEAAGIEAKRMRDAIQSARPDQAGSS